MSSTFIGLGLPRDLADHLAAQGITEPSPIQEATLADLLAGRDVCAAAPTGSGKTLAFGAPLMARLGKGTPNRPAALVLTPTRELAAQIHDVLCDLGRVRKRWSGTVYGGVRQGPQVNNLRRGVDVLVACPGRLEDLIEQGHVALDNVRTVVIDEADRMSDMGFLPCVRRIVDQTHPDRQTMLFSATLDGAADDLARTHLKDPARHAVAAKEEDLGKATHLFWTAQVHERPDLAASIVRKAGRTVLFTRTKHGADRLVETLNSLGVQAAVIHGGRSQAQRDKSLADFHRGHVAALVATDVAARGIHVEKVACVVHVDLPDSPTDYQHRSGRTARAGERGTVVSLVTPQQRKHAAHVQRHFGFPKGHSKPDMEQIEAGEVAVRVERHDRSARGDRHERTDSGERPQRRDRFEKARTERTTSAGGDRPWQPRDDRKPWENKGERKPWENKGERKPWDNTGDRKPYNQRNDGKPGDNRGGLKPWENRPARPAGDRPYGQQADRKPWENRGERKPWENRDARPASDRPYGQRDERKPADRPWQRDDRPARPVSDRPYGQRDERKPYGQRDERPARTYADRPWQNGTDSRRERNGRPWENGTDRKPWENRDARPAGASDRPWENRSSAPRDGRPVSDRGPRRPAAGPNRAAPAAPRGYTRPSGKVRGRA